MFDATARHIGIIGCGIFGARIALDLATAGMTCTVLERNTSILSGASYNNHNRLHLGFHYPRALETARQCVAGFDRFVRDYPFCVRDRFPNAYFIADDPATHVSSKDYLAFCRSLGVSVRPFTPALYPVAVSDVVGGVFCDETVYDSAMLGHALLDRLLKNERITLRTGIDILRITKSRGQFVVESREGGIRVDAVVNVAYADQNRLTASAGLDVEARRFEYTVVPVVRTALPTFGVTIMDGPFFTLLPFGKSDRSLLYHVDHSVVAAEEALFVDRAWLDPALAPLDENLSRARFELMRDAAMRFVPALRGMEVLGFLHGPRAVLVQRDDTDARPSLVDEPLPGYFTVFSGKVDHCTWVADEVVARLLSQAVIGA